ncbi:MAG: 4-(cytidine 5'-diphospho)-2-C-methyl-D-erythritol kinase [Deltaproteobacteria bacterium]|nr:4-(cytidine 5'-diphospho)-2-C-methyl-D-erythritol kinase [Deltaproteobacteria bacterium]
MNTLTIKAPAKINLFLKVTGKRRDGYHELSTLMCRVGLYDRIVLCLDQPCITVRCPHPSVPEGEQNLAFKAAAAFFETLGITHGVGISIDKRIPVGAGLGGGSSDAAAVLTALNNHYGTPLTQEVLMRLALTVGADVPFFIFGKTALVTGIGEKLRPVAGMPRLWAVLVYPRFEISTAWVYKHLNLQLTKCEENYNVSWFLEDLSRFKDLLFNDLEQVSTGAFPEIQTLKRALIQGGAAGALMCGSGSAVFGLFETRRQAVRGLEGLKRRFACWDMFLADLLLP